LKQVRSDEKKSPVEVYGKVKTWIRDVWSSAFVQNVVVLMSGTALAQALQFAISPVLSRLYEPSAFGLLGVFLATKSIVSVVSAAKYELSIVLPERDDVAVNLFALGGGIVVLVSTGILLGVMVGRFQLSALLGEPQLAPYLWWLPLAVLAAGLYKVLNYWSTRKKHYTRLSISQGVRSVGVAGTQVPAGYLQAGPTGLVGGQVAGQVLATVALGAQILREDWRRIWKFLSLRKMRVGAIEYSNFPVYTAPQDLTNSISQNIPSYLLAFFFSSEAVGFYWFTRRLLNAPSRLVGRAVRKVFYQRASEKHAEGKRIFSDLWKTTAGLAGLTVVPVLVILAAGPPIFGFAFGGEWERAGRYAQWLILWWAVGFINIPAMMLVHTFSLQHLLFGYEVVQAVARVLAIALGAYVGDDLTSIMLFSIVGMICNGALVGFMFWYVRDRTYSEAELHE
jgi:O-antigen/teichoic acid export membrane protein